jgi:exonuclease-1
LSGCDYLAPLGGIGLKTLHKYFLKYKTLDRVLYALRREANKLITKEYETEFLKAELTFQHQTVYCPIEKRLVNLNPLPDNIKSNMELETDESFDNLNFLGPVLESEMAIGIAEGRINPITFKPLFIIEEPLKENIPLPVSVKSTKQSPMKLKNFLMNTASSTSDRITLKRPVTASYSTQTESIQNNLRSKFQSIPKYANVRKPTSTTLNKQRAMSDGKQFSILNFCVPKSSFNPDDMK